MADPCAAMRSFLAAYDADGRLVEPWMVDARPADSDGFWS